MNFSPVRQGSVDEGIASNVASRKSKKPNKNINLQLQRKECPTPVESAGEVCRSRHADWSSVVSCERNGTIILSGFNV
jgi:hypothetical protein